MDNELTTSGYILLVIAAIFIAIGLAATIIFLGNTTTKITKIYIGYEQLEAIKENEAFVEQDIDAIYARLRMLEIAYNEIIPTSSTETIDCVPRVLYPSK
jgi:hypothetical protein